MNNKGFTLVELLAVIVILSVLGGIATYGVINAINASKDKAEDAFLNEIGKQVEMYIDLNSFKKSGEGISFSKVISNNISDDGKTGSKVTRDITGWEMVSDGRRLNLNDLITAGYMERDDIKNPNTNEKCDLNNEVIVYMDSDFVYYYYVDFDSNDCITNGKIVNTLPKELVCKINELKTSYNNSPNVSDKCS